MRIICENHAQSIINSNNYKAYKITKLHKSLRQDTRFSLFPSSFWNNLNTHVMNMRVYSVASYVPPQERR